MTKNRRFKLSSKMFKQFTDMRQAMQYVMMLMEKDTQIAYAQELKRIDPKFFEEAVAIKMDLNIDWASKEFVVTQTEDPEKKAKEADFALKAHEQNAK